MIEVTAEMRIFLSSAWKGDITRDEAVKGIIELHEKSKPKPEPVAYRFPYAHSVDVDGEIVYQYSHRKDYLGKWYKAEPLYTTPPTREPLSDYELKEILNDIAKGDGTLHDFARAVEQAHGIGVTND